MASLNRAQTGNRVYGGISQSPNRGRVSAKGAQGYIKREMRNQRQSGVTTPVGRDGASDNRSTVAARALQRQNQMFNNQGRPLAIGLGKGQQGRLESRPYNPGTQLQSHPYSPGGRNNGNPGGKNKHPDQGGKPGKPPAPPGQPQQPGQDPNATNVPQVTVNDAGLLELPYNQDFMMEQYQALQQANDQLLGLNTEANQQAMEYNTAKRDNQLAYNNLQGQTLNQNAARGTAFSSAYGTAVANNAGAFANQMGDLESQNTGFLQNQNLQRTAIQNSLNQQLQALAQQYADQLGGDAGNLGYGTQTQQIKKGRNTSIWRHGSRDIKIKKGDKRGKNDKAGNKGRSHESSDDRKRRLQAGARRKLRSH